MDTFPKRLRRLTASIVIVACSMAAVPPAAFAAAVGTEQVLAATGDHASGWVRCSSAPTWAALQARGVDAQQARARVDALTDDEAAQLAAHVDQFQPAATCSAWRSPFS